MITPGSYILVVWLYSGSNPVTVATYPSFNACTKAGLVWEARLSNERWNTVGGTYGCIPAPIETIKKSVEDPVVIEVKP